MDEVKQSDAVVNGPEFEVLVFWLGSMLLMHTCWLTKLKLGHDRA